MGERDGNDLDGVLADNKVTRSYVERRREISEKTQARLERYLEKEKCGWLREEAKISIAYSKVLFVANAIFDSIRSDGCFTATGLHKQGDMAYQVTPTIERFGERVELPNGYEIVPSGYRVSAYVIKPYYKKGLFGRQKEDFPECIGKISVDFDSEGNIITQNPARIEIYGEKSLGHMRRIKNGILYRLDKDPLGAMSMDISRGVPITLYNMHTITKPVYPRGDDRFL